jgi:hypothetical protein
MHVFMALGIVLLINLILPGYAWSANFAYEVKQTSQTWGPTVCLLRNNAARIDATKIGLAFIFVDGSDKVQIVNLNEHTVTMQSLLNWNQVGLGLYQYGGHQLDMVPSGGQGRITKVFGLHSITYKGGPDRPKSFSAAHSANDVWLYTEATFCDELPLSKQMNQFIAGAFRIGTERCFFPLRCVAICTASKHFLLDTLSIKRLNEKECQVDFVKGYREVAVDNVMSSRPNEDFASELMKVTAPPKH